MEVSGTILVIGETQEVGSNGFRKRLLVVETDENYKQKIPMDFVQDKTSLLDGYAVGQSVKVGINLRGNEYNGKYYLNAQGWRIDKVNGGTAPAPPQPDFNNMVGEDDLAF